MTRSPAFRLSDLSYNLAALEISKYYAYYIAQKLAVMTHVRAIFTTATCNFALNSKGLQSSCWKSIYQHSSMSWVITYLLVDYSFLVSRWRSSLFRLSDRPIATYRQFHHLRDIHWPVSRQLKCCEGSGCLITRAHFQASVCAQLRRASCEASCSMRLADRVVSCWHRISGG